MAATKTTILMKRSKRLDYLRVDKLWAEVLPDGAMFPEVVLATLDDHLPHEEVDKDASVANLSWKMTS